MYKNSGKNSEFSPYLLDITNNMHKDLKVKVVVPLCSNDYAISYLNPYFNINGKKLYMSTIDIADIPSSLKEEVSNLSEYRNDIIEAIDFLINRF